MLVTSPSATERTVNTLCNVVDSFNKGIWVISASSGIPPESLYDLRAGDVMVTSKMSEVKHVASDIDKASVNAAIVALSSWLGSGSANG